MTPFRNDDENPFGRRSLWPAMPHTPLRIATLPKAAPKVDPRPASPTVAVVAEVTVTPAELDLEAADAPIVVAEPMPEPEYDPEADLMPIAAPIGVRQTPAPRRDMRVAPLIVAAAVGAGGMAALFLTIGPQRPATAAAPAAPKPANLALSGSVAPAAPAAVAPALTPSPATPVPPAAPAAARGAPRQMAAATLRPTSARFRAPAAPPAASVVGAAEPPPDPPAPTPFVRLPGPDREAPIPSHVPNQS